MFPSIFIHGEECFLEVIISNINYFLVIVLFPFFSHLISSFCESQTSLHPIYVNSTCMSAITTIATHCCTASKGHSHLLKFQIHLPNTSYVIFLYFSTPNICLFASSSFALYSTRSCLFVPTYVLVLITCLPMIQRKALDILALCM